jgi:hypothetical protein
MCCEHAMMHHIANSRIHRVRDLEPHGARDLLLPVVGVQAADLLGELAAQVLVLGKATAEEDGLLKTELAVVI